MRVIIAGCRWIEDYELVEEAMREAGWEGDALGPQVSIAGSGGAPAPGREPDSETSQVKGGVGVPFLRGRRIDAVLCGGARGVDALGERCAEERGIKVEYHRADWVKYGRAAGAVRNGEMAKYADGLVAVWDGESRGTGHMIALAKVKGLWLYVFEVEEVWE